MNIKLKLILGFSGIFIMIFLWNILAVGELQKIPDDYELITQLEGSTRILLSIGEEITDPIRTNDILRNKVVKKEGNTLEISSTWTDYDILTGDKIWEYSNTYFIDATTYKHVGDKDGYYSFPPHVKKQNYDFFDPWTIVPSTFVFEKTIFIDDLEVYVFSCESLGNDLSSTYTQFSPRIIWNDIICEVWVEPVSGQEVFIELSWDNNFFEDGSKIPVHVGRVYATEFTTATLIDSAKNQKQVFFLYEIIMPLLLGIIASTILLGVVAINEKIKSDFLNKQRTIKLEKDVMTERLTAIGNLSSRLAHDIRNPLSVISSDFSIMKRKHPELDKDSVRRIDRGIDRINHQVQSVMNFIKLKPSLLKNHSALELLESVLDSMNIQKDIKVNLPDNNSQIFCDKEQCEILFYNLIFNAVQELEKKGGTISIRIIEQDNSIIMEFEDSGLGIPRENLDKVFEPLFTTKQRGTGLGLASCKNIMEQFGGKISVKTNPTIFTLVFQRKKKTVKNYSGKKN